MRKIITTTIPSHKYYYQPHKANKNFITDNIISVKQNNNGKIKINESNYKKEYKFNVNIPYLAPRKKTPMIEKQKLINPINKTKLEDIKTIDYFVRRIKEVNISYIENNNKNVIHKGILNWAKKEKTTELFLNKTNLLGNGTYGTAYRVGNFVIKVPFYYKYKINPHSNVKRCSLLLNQLNKDNDFSRAITLDNKNDILISKYINGKNILEKEAYDFVKQRGRIMFDYNSKGNVKMDNNRKKYIIDADLVAQPMELKRYPSLGTLVIHEVYKNMFIKEPLKPDEIAPLYYSEIKDFLPK